MVIQKGIDLGGSRGMSHFGIWHFLGYSFCGCRVI